MSLIQTEKLGVEQVLKRIEAAENRHDVDGMLEEMIDDPLIHVCGVPPVKGQNALRQLYQEFFKTFVSTNITSQQVFVASAGDMAWEYGAYVNEFQGPDGRISEAGKYIGIYHKVDGRWQAATYCITPNGN